MAQLKYLDNTGLSTYDAKIKEYIEDQIITAGTLAEGYADTAESNAKSYTDAEVASAKTYADQKAGEVLSGTVGSTTQPVYLNNGVITAIGHTIEVDVPSNAKFTDTTYTGGSGISVSGTTINHTNTVTAGVIGQKTNESVAFGGTIDIPYADYDANGHIVSKGERIVTLPAAPTTITGNAGTASKLQTARTITLAGDVSGSVSFDGSDNVSITTTVADDSHNHTIANIDNLQTTLNAKAPLASPTFTGTPKIGSANIATETYVTEAIAEHVAEVAGGLQYKGTVGTGGTVTSLPTSGVKVGDFYKVATAGQYGGHTCEVNDMILASEVEPDIVWDVLQANIDGAVTGPSSSTADHLAAFSNTTGKIIKDSGLTTSSISSTITKVNGIASGAEVNQNAFSTVIAGGTSLAATSKTDSLTLTASGPVTISGSGKTATIGISAATTSSAGSMSAADKTKLDGIATGANKYTHPTTSGNKHIPSGGSSGQILKWSADGTAVWGAEKTYTLSSFGVTATAAELNYVDGVTSNIQTQLNAKQATITGAASSVTTSNLTAGRALIAGSDGKIAVSAATSTELGYLDGVTSSVQNQLNGKQATITGAATTITGSNLTSNRALVSDASGKVAISAVTSTELGYLDGVTSAIQTQLNGKAASSHNHSASNITSGTLPIARGGTGATSASAALTALGAAASGHTHAKSLYKPTKTYQKVAFTNSTSSATISPYNANMDIEVYFNGFLLMEGEEYNRSGATITFTTALGGTGVEQTLVIVKRDYS